MSLKQKFRKFIRPHGKIDFLYSLAPDVSILDVGCGNNSPYITKQILPEAQYTGIDISDYNQREPNHADEYVLVSPDVFASTIATWKERFDAIVCAHNIEHCDDRMGTLAAVLAAVKPGGHLFLSFPSANSIHFPKRMGTLNYNDDPTHRDTPPDFQAMSDAIRGAGFDIRFSTAAHRPRLLRTIGTFLEPISSLSRSVMRGTWEYYGFEAIIIAQKRT